MFELFDVTKWRDFEIWVSDYSSSLEMAIYNYGLASLSICRCAGAHITHCICQRQFFRLIFVSHALHVHSTVHKREHWTHSKCFEEILQHTFYYSQVNVTFVKDQ